MGVKLTYVGAPGDGLRDGDVVEVMGRVHAKGGDAVDHGEMEKAEFDRFFANPHFKVEGKPKPAPKTRKVQLIEEPDEDPAG